MDEAPDQGSRREIRLSSILDRVLQERAVTGERLCQQQEVTAHTIRRDVQDLKGHGWLAL